MVRSYFALQNVDQGYAREDAMTWEVTLSGAHYEEPGARHHLVREALRQLAALPGVDSLGAVNFLPISEEGWAARRFEGFGIADSGNLFVPFFSTKPEGSGIGLLLSRQIAEAHGGRLQLRNRKDGRGARAELEIPIGAKTDAANRRSGS